MKRISVVAIVVAATLVLEAAAFFAVFSVRQVGDDGYAVLYGRQRTECDDGGGCTVYSKREFSAAVVMILQKLKAGSDI